MSLRTNDSGSLKAARIAATTLAVSAWFGLAGCSSKPPEQAPVAQPAVQPKPEVEEKPAAPAKPDPAVVWADLVKDGQKLLEDGKLDELDAHFAKFDGVYTDDAKPGTEQTAAVEDLKTKLAEKIEERQDKVREDKLAAASELVGQGKYEEATSAINEVQKLAPSSQQRQQAADLAADIESRRSARRRLATWMQLLASSDKKEIRTAQTQLHKEADTALPLLLEAVQSEDNPVLVTNTLELLRRVQRPNTTLPAMYGVLKREKQSKNWADAVREIGRINAAGIGPQLLDLTLSSKNPEQRAAALQALAQVPDPPADTLTKLLPQLFEDGPDLPAALQATAQAVRLHRQYDVVARRGFDGELTDEQSALLAKLAPRLEQIIEAGAKATPPSEAVEAAKVLAVTTRQRAPQPFESIKILSVGAQSEDGKASAVLDGVWNKTEYPTMWRHPIDRRSTIILDLGEEKTVEGVRIWNFNEPNGTHRGWKEVEVFVSANQNALTPVATGIVLPAPGAADTPDYSTTIPVPSVRGRYVTLQAKSVWRPDAYMGLSEIQVLGY